MPDAGLHVRRATADDAERIAAVLQAVTAERVHSAIDRPWSVAEQRRYLASLSPRDAFHLAATDTGEVVGYQSLDRYSTVLDSMAHVGQLGTFVLPAWRGRGVGRALFGETTRFAAAAGYRKFVIAVRASNASAQAFYRRLGFADCGRLQAQVVIDGRDDDEILMEFFLTISGPGW
ncbi:MAG: GNAT family N-acetyltransferase [Acidimicrobiia bacterium]|nr:GNAT family N-acetyltransferase [Acidimicrobiia bacterium]